MRRHPCHCLNFVGNGNPQNAVSLGSEVHAVFGVGIEQVLDIGLIAIEEILTYADSDGLRAYETWEKHKNKVKKQREQMDNG